MKSPETPVLLALLKSIGGAIVEGNIELDAKVVPHLGRCKAQLVAKRPRRADEGGNSQKRSDAPSVSKKNPRKVDKSHDGLKANRHTRHGAREPGIRPAAHQRRKNEDQEAGFMRFPLLIRDWLGKQSEDRGHDAGPGAVAEHFCEAGEEGDLKTQRQNRQPG